MKKSNKQEEKKNGEQRLRNAAEEKLRGSSKPSSKMKEVTTKELLHELQVHQIELEMQNEELRRVQLTLEESRQRFADLYDFAPVGYFTFTREGLIKEVNLTGTTLLGVDRQKLINRRFRGFVETLDSELWDQHFLNVIKQREKQSCELLLNRQDGSTFFAGLESIRLELSQGVIEVHTTINDITEKKQAEEALQNSGVFLNSIIDQSPSPIWISDAQGTLIRLNQALRALLNISDEDVVGKYNVLKDNIVEEQGFLPLVRRVFEEGETARFELRYDSSRLQHLQLRHFAFVILDVSIFPIRDGSGRITNAVIQHLNITERKRAEESLRKSEKQFKSLYDNAAGGIFQTTPEGRVITANKVFARMFGYESPEEVINTLTDIAYQLYVRTDDCKMIIDTLKERGYLRNYECQLRQKDGSIFWGSISVRLAETVEGIACFEGLIIDVSERRQAEEKLKQSEKRYRELYDFLPIPIYEMDFEANITSANRAIYETFRGTEEDLKKGIKAWQLLSPEEIEKSAKNIQRLLKGELVEGTEYTLMRLDGSVFPAIVISSVIYSNDQTVGLRGVIVDITERKQAEEKLRESDERYKALFDRSLDFIYITDFEGRFIDANNAALDRLGYTKEEIRSLSFASLLSEDQLPLALKIVQEIREPVIQMGLMEFRLRHKNGSEVYVETQGSIVMSNGTPVAIQAIARDITERKQDQEKLNQTLENLRKALGGIIQVIAATVESRDPYTAGHQRRTADLSRAIAEEMGLTEDQQEGLLMAGIIHDLGKIAIPAEILSKPSQLSEIEYKLIKEHPQVGFEILKNIDFPWPIAEIVLKHHERMNGSGYPQGLKGKEICQEAKILMVADVVEAMASYRPYRPALGIEAALEEIEKNKGVLYDPEVVEVCLSLFRERGFKFE